MKRKTNLLISVLLAGVVMCALAPVSQAAPAAVFDLRKGLGEVDTVLGVGEMLNLDLYVTVSGATSNVQLISFFMDLDPGENNVISFQNDYVDDSGIDGILPNGTDNAPITGEFSRTVQSITGVAFANGVPTRIGHFSVKAVGLGTAQYAFGDDGLFRNWALSTAADGFASLSQVAVPIISVVPEPAAAFLVLLGLGLVSRRRPR